MKTFKDLEFKQHRTVKAAEQATMTFDDGSYISVLRMKDTWDDEYAGLYCSQVSYEILSNRFRGCQHGTWGNDRQSKVDGWVDQTRITNHMKYIQSNPL